MYYIIDKFEGHQQSNDEKFATLNAKIDYLIYLAEKNTNSSIGAHNSVDEVSETINNIKFPIDSNHELKNLNTILLNVDVKTKLVNT